MIFIVSLSFIFDARVWMHDSKRAGRLQIAIEFMVIYSFVIIIFIIIFALIANQRAQTLAQQQAALMNLLAQTVAGYINQAVIAGNGYSASIPITSVVGINPYNISISSTGIVLASVSIGKETVSGEAFSDTGSLIINGTKITSSNSITLYKIPAYKGSVFISNQKGIVYVDYMPPSLNALSGSASSIQSAGAYAPMFNGANSLITASYKLKTSQSLTVSAWIYVSSFSSINPIVVGWNGTSYTYNLSTDGLGRINFVVCSSGCASKASVASSVELAAGGWYNVAGTYNSISGLETIYLNGFSAGTSTKTLTPKNSNAIFIGGAPSVGYTNGYIEDVQVYNTSLSSNQIFMLYSSGPSSLPSNSTFYLIGYWPLNGNPNDYSGHGIDGIANSIVFNPVAAISTKVLANSGSPESGVPVTIWAGSNLIDGSNSITLLTENDGNASALIQSNTFNGGKVKVYSTAFNGNLSTLSGLIRWWQISNQRGNSVIDYAGSRVNGFFNNGTYEPIGNSTNFQVADFNGANSMITTNSAVSANAFTIAFWVKVSNALNLDSYHSYDILDSTGSNATALKLSGLLSNAITPTLTLSAFSPASETITCCNSNSINGTLWNFIAVTVNGTAVSGNGIVSADFYVNGSEFPGSVRLAPPYTFNKMSIAQMGDSADYFAGNMSNLQVYGSALSLSQLNSIYKQGISGAPAANSGLLFWYPFFGSSRNYANYNISQSANSITYQNLQSVNITAAAGAFSSVSGKAVNATNVRYLSSSVPLFNGRNSSIFLQAPVLPSASACNLTITAWAYDSGMPGQNGYVFDFPGSGNNGYASVSYNDNSLTFGLGKAGNSWSINGAYKGRWIFVADDVRSGNAIGYLNGVPAGTPPTYSVGCLSNYGASNSGIGYSGTQSSGHYFNGSIEDVQVYNTSLSQTQIDQLYVQGLPAIELVNVSLG